MMERLSWYIWIDFARPRYKHEKKIKSVKREEIKIDQASIAR